jgi:hypothetical protein
VLLAYPRSYREARGEEITATLLDSGEKDGRLSLGETAALLRHASGVRVRRLRPALIIVLLALLGAAVGGGVEWAAGPSKYVATETVNSPSVNETELQRQAVQFRAVLALPGFSLGRSTACSAAVVSRTVSLTCSSPSAIAARSAVGYLVDGLGPGYFNWQRLVLQQGTAALPIEISSERAHVESLTAALRELPESSPRFEVLAVQIRKETQTLDSNALLWAHFTVQIDSAPRLLVVSGPAQPVYRISSGEIAIGASIGLLVGAAAVAIRQRRKPRPPVVAT